MLSCTIILPDVREYLIHLAQENNIPIVDLMGPMMKVFSEIVEIKPHLEPGLVRRIDEDYFKRMEAIEFAVNYDDGKDPRIVPSRCGPYRCIQNLKNTFSNVFGPQEVEGC